MLIRNKNILPSNSPGVVFYEITGDSDWVLSLTLNSFFSAHGLLQL